MKTQLINNLSHEDYLALDKISNGELQLIQRNPSDYIWNKTAPRNDSKAAAFDFGSALHMAILEPELFNEENIDVYTDTKTRDTKKFHDYMAAQDGKKLVLMEAEYTQLRLMVDSALAHPSFAFYIENATHKETTIIAGDVKTRPDLMIIDQESGKCSALCDVKTTANIDDWRSDAKWKNPLFTHGYGHTAALYMETASHHFNQEINEYTFLVLQKSVEFGRYPVAIFVVTRDELIRYGFFDSMFSNLETYRECKAQDNWFGKESFPQFYVKEDGIEISDEE